MSISEIAIAPHRNAMRARYKDRSEKSTNGVGMITPLHYARISFDSDYVQPQYRHTAACQDMKFVSEWAVACFQDARCSVSHSDWAASTTFLVPAQRSTLLL